MPVNVDPSFWSLPQSAQMPHLAGIPSAIPTIAQTVTGSAEVGTAAAVGMAIAGGMQGGNGGGAQYQPIVPTGDVPRTVEGGQWWDWLQDIISGLIPGVQESMGELPDAIRGYAQVHGGSYKSWTAESKSRFWAFNDGTIATIKKNGRVKTWKPAKHIVVPRNPRIGTLLRADKRTDKLVGGLARRAGYTRRKKT